MIRIEFASADQRDDIYRMRHDVYAVELGQHAVNSEGRLTDPLDAFNHYVVATRNGRVIGFVAITPPGHGQYSVDKYVPREALPFVVDDGLFEVRILTVDAAHRGGPVAGLLMYAALRWVEDHGATRMVIIGRSEVAGLYERAGLRRLGRTIRSGAVSYELMAATIDDIRAGLPRFRRLLGRFPGRVEWSLTVPFERGPGAFHGGASHAELGARPSARRRGEVIAADVLDAWFEPAPAVVRALSGDAAFLAATSPTTYPTDLRNANRRYARHQAGVGRGRRRPFGSHLPMPATLDRRVGAGRAHRAAIWRVSARSRRAHRLSDRVDLDRSRGRPDAAASTVGHRRWGLRLGVHRRPQQSTRLSICPGLTDGRADGHPSNNTCLDRSDIRPVLMPGSTLERLAAASRNIVVATSMSKAWALSGLRVGFLCGPPELIADAWQATPPWIVGRPAQIGALAALSDPVYYADRFRATAVLRDQLRAGLSSITGVQARDGHANFALCELDPPLDASTVLERSAARGLYVEISRPKPASAIGRFGSPYGTARGSGGSSRYLRTPWRRRVRREQLLRRSQGMLRHTP